MKITLAHGSGGASTSVLIDEIFAKAFSNPILNRMEDCAVVTGDNQIAITTDSFVVDPIFFKGGDIGRLAICGTVNDLLMRGAVPKYITCGFIIETGADSEDLKTIAASMAETAEEANVIIVAGDTKVIQGNGGVYINTSGVGFVPEDRCVYAANCRVGDDIIISGTLGDHHCAILSHRMNIENSIESDCAPLLDMSNNLFCNGIDVHAMRDVTRGGLATVLNELAQASHCCMEIFEDKIPVNDQVKSFCQVLGLNPLQMGNEGKMVLFVPHESTKHTLELLRNSAYGENSTVIGTVVPTDENGQGKVVEVTSLGGRRRVSVLTGEGLPRIC